MDALPTIGARNDLHRSAGIITPIPDTDFGKTASPCWKQGAMPSKQTVGRHRLLVLAGYIQRKRPVSPL